MDSFEKLLEQVNLTGEMSVDKFFELMFGNTDALALFSADFKSKILDPTSKAFESVFSKLNTKLKIADRSLDNLNMIQVVNALDFSKQKEQIDKKFNDIANKLDGKLKDLDKEATSKTIGNQPPPIPPRFSAAPYQKSEKEIEQKQTDDETLISFSPHAKEYLNDLLLNKFLILFEKREEKMFSPFFNELNKSLKNIKGVNSGSGGLTSALEDAYFGSKLLKMLAPLATFIVDMAPAIAAIIGIGKIVTGPLGDWTKAIVANTMGTQNVLYKFLDKTSQNYDKQTSLQKEQTILTEKYLTLGGLKLQENFSNSRAARVAFDAGKEVELPARTLANRAVSKVPVVRSLYSRITGQDIRPETMEAAKKLQKEKTLQEAAQAAEAAKKGMSVEQLKFFKQFDETQKVEQGLVTGTKALEETSTLGKILSWNSKALEYVSKAPLLGSLLKSGPGKWIFKKIPAIGALLSIALGSKQIQDGDMAGGILTILGGLASIIPVYGTLASIVLDGINWLGHYTGQWGSAEDLEAYKKKAAEDQVRAKGMKKFQAMASTGKAKGKTEEQIKKEIDEEVRKEVEAKLKYDEENSPEAKYKAAQAAGTIPPEDHKGWHTEGHGRATRWVKDPVQDGIFAKGTVAGLTSPDGKYTPLNPNDEVIAGPFGSMNKEVVAAIENMSNKLTFAMTGLSQRMSQDSGRGNTSVNVSNSKSGGISYNSSSDDMILRFRTKQYMENRSLRYC